MKNKKTVYIGIPAHNEERNIGALLESILTQNRQSYELKAVIVACDGCTDRTAEIVRSYAKKHTPVNVIDDGRRIGQSARLNEFYKLADTDLFITFDADTTLAGPDVVDEIVSCFDNAKVGLVGGHDQPLPQTTFIGKSLEAYQIFWREMVTHVDGGDNIHHHPGCVSAGRVDFLKHVTIPLNILANDHFLYFEALKQGYRFKAAPKAVVYFKVPSTLHDYLKQTTRFYDSADNVRRHFGSWVEDHYAIPREVKLRAYLVAFLRKPFYMTSAIVLQILQLLMKSRFTEKSTNGVWSTVKSSK